MARQRGRGRRELKSEINIVPLLDVLLVLLLIFMATAPCYQRVCGVIAAWSCGIR
jgi:biopolymer transport protein ExbD